MTRVRFLISLLFNRPYSSLSWQDKTLNHYRMIIESQMKEMTVLKSKLKELL